MHFFKLGLIAFFCLPLFLGAGESGVLRIGCLDFPASLNPVYATSETAQGVMNKIYQALFYFDQTGAIRPELVQSLNWDEGQLTITITLRKDVRFADGSVLQSRDVQATVELLKDPLYEYPYLSDLNFIEKVTVVDPLNFRIRLKDKFAPWKSYLTFKILNADDIRGLSPAAFRKHVPLGCGPYRLKTVAAPRQIVLMRNPHCVERNSFEKIVYSALGDPRQGPLKLLANELDAVEVQADEVRSFNLLPEWRRCFSLLKYRKFGYTYLVFNLENPAVDLDLRRLFYNRMHASPFLKIFLNGAGETVYSPFLYLSSGIHARLWPAVSPPRRLRLRILANSESVLRKQLVLFLCEEMKAFNIDLEPMFVEYQTFLKYLKQGNFDLAVSAYLLDMDWNLKDVLSSSGYFNYAGLADGEMDALLEQGLREMDEKKRRQIYVRAHQRWLETLPFLPLFSLNYYMGASRSLKIPADHFRTVSSTGDFFYNLQGW